MARGRMISTTVAIDRRLNSLSLESQFLFLMTVPHLDRDGLIAGDAPLLAGKAIPRRTELHTRIGDLVQEWIAADLAIAYDGPDTLILFFPGFRKNQSLQYNKEGASQFPPPPGYIRNADGLALDPNKTTLEEIQSKSRPTLEEATVKGIEVKEEVEGKKKGSVPPAPPMPAQSSASSGRAQVERLKKLNAQVSPELRTPLANVLLDITGKRAIAEIANTTGETILGEAHETAVALYQMGYKTESQILALEPAWADDWRGKKGGSFKQFLEFASERLAGRNGNGAHPQESNIDAAIRLSNERLARQAEGR